VSEANHNHAIPGLMDSGTAEYDIPGFARNYAVPGLMRLDTPRAEDDAILVNLPAEGLDLHYLNTSGVRTANTVLHGDGTWRSPDTSGAVGQLVERMTFLEENALIVTSTDW
jgi:hypothetical protein